MSVMLLLVLLGTSDLTALARRFAHEPSIAEVQRAVVRRFRLRSKSDAWTLQARLSPLLPSRFQIRYGNDAANDLTTTDSGEKLTNRVDTDSDRRLLFIGEWNLSQLIFNPTLLKIADTELRRTQRRQVLLLLVTRVYFQRRRLQILAWLQPAPTRLERLTRRLEIARLAAVIDGLTGGVFRQKWRRTAR